MMDVAPSKPSPRGKAKARGKPKGKPKGKRAPLSLRSTTNASSRSSAFISRHGKFMGPSSGALKQ